MQYRTVRQMDRKRNKDPCTGCVWPMYRERGKVICPFQRCVRKEYEPLWRKGKKPDDGKAETH